MIKPIYLPAYLLVATLTLSACHSPGYRLVTIKPTAETTAVNSAGDAADDPAIWIHPTDPEKSMVLGTQKKQGLYSYALNGNHLQFIAAGRLNNVDVRQGLDIGLGLMDIAAASNRSNNDFSLFSIDRNSGYMTELSDIHIPSSTLQEVYGFCMGNVKDSHVIFVMTGKNANAELYQLDMMNKRIKKIRELQINTQSEGCVIDDDTGDIYIGEENYGIWRFNYYDQNIKEDLIQVSHKAIKADIEGLALFVHHNKKYLMISSQGNSTYPILDLQQRDIVSVITIDASKRLDRVTGTDGIEVNDALKTTAYPEGIFVAQDDKNTKPIQNQNFKMMSLSDVLSSIDR